MDLILWFWPMQTCKCSMATVPVKCKLTVSTRNSILDPWYFRESSFEFRGSSFEFRGSSIEFRVSSMEFLVSSIEFRVSRRLKNFSRKRFKSWICNNGRNNTVLGAASFIRARVHVFHINVQIVSLELKSWIAIIYLPFVAWKTRTSQPNKNVCQREIIFLISIRFQWAQISTCTMCYRGCRISKCQIT